MKKILIVDDEEKIRRIYGRLLTGEGYEVIERSNAMEASETLVREGADIVLLDIKMPEVDGGIMYDVIKMFHRKIRVIVSSVYPIDEQKRIIPDAEDYHDKSQGIEILLGKIKRALGNGQEGGYDGKSRHF